MTIEKILLALEEKQKWEKREIELLQSLRETRIKKKEALTELEETKKKMDYYISLAEGLKEAVEQPAEVMSTAGQRAMRTL